MDESTRDWRRRKRENDVFLSVVFLVVVGFLLSVVLYGHRLIERDADRCAASGGVYVRAAPGGYVCVRGSVVKDSTQGRER